MAFAATLAAAGFAESSPSFWTRGDSVIRINGAPDPDTRIRKAQCTAPFSVFSTRDSHTGALDCATASQAIAVAAVLDALETLTGQLAASAFGLLLSPMGAEYRPASSDAAAREVTASARRLLSAALSATLESAR